MNLPLYMTQLTPTQQDLVRRVREGGGLIERRPGGFWTLPGMKDWDDRPGVPRWYQATGTVQALAKRGVLEVTKTAGNPPFAVEYKLVERMLLQ